VDDPNPYTFRRYGASGMAAERIVAYVAVLPDGPREIELPWA